MLQGYGRQGESKATRETSHRHTSPENAAGAAANSIVIGGEGNGVANTEGKPMPMTKLTGLGTRSQKARCKCNAFSEKATAIKTGEG